MRQGTKLRFNMQAVFDVGDAGRNRRLVLIILLFTTLLFSPLSRNRRGHILMMHQGTKLRFNMETVFDVGDAGRNGKLVLVIEVVTVAIVVIIEA